MFYDTCLKKRIFALLTHEICDLRVLLNEDGKIIQFIGNPNLLN